MLMAVWLITRWTSGRSSFASAPRRPPLTRDQLRADLADFVADYMSQSIQDMDLSGAVSSLFEIIQRYNITLPPPLSLLLRTLVELEGTGTNN